MEQKVKSAVSTAGGYDLARLPLLPGVTTHKGMRTNVHPRGQRETACLGSSEHFHQPGPAGGFLFTQMLEPSWPGCCRSAQDLIPSPLGVISKLMLGSNGPDSLSPYLRARTGSPRLTPIVSNILRRITAHVKCNFGDPQYALR